LQIVHAAHQLFHRASLLTAPTQVVTTADLSRCLSASVQQAFLPKFENEGQDSSIADAIVQQVN
jgi:hypothetical protein